MSGLVMSGLVMIKPDPLESAGRALFVCVGVNFSDAGGRGEMAFLGLLQVQTH